MSQLLGVSEDKLMRMVQQNEMLGTIGGDAMNIFNEDYSSSNKCFFIRRKNRRR